MKGGTDFWERRKCRCHEEGGGFVSDNESAKLSTRSSGDRQVMLEDAKSSSECIERFE